MFLVLLFEVYLILLFEAYPMKERPNSSCACLGEEHSGQKIATRKPTTAEVNRAKIRARLLVRGVVQGVGFRPFVDRFARQHHLTGWVLNSSAGVEIEIEGQDDEIERFVQGVCQQAPPRAIITDFDLSYHPPAGYIDFTIRESVAQPQEFTLISPDLGICPDCLRELRDPANRRYGYPFINCTNCGPRYTIIQDIPYDRPNTTMKKFTMCPACEKEYNDPQDRRFHAQPNACWDCGPRIWLTDAQGQAVAAACSDTCDRHKVMAQARELLARGKILAIKGLGGFHLACDARNEQAVQALRQRKHREGKPFALMVATVDEVRLFCHVSEPEERSLTSAAAPIVLLRKRDDALVAPSVAPRSEYFGVMLPYTPLHHLLLSDGPCRILVMTSGNISQEPIVISNEEALARLAGIADYFLFHDRDIYTRADDSIVHLVEGKEAILRRSRGWCPLPIHLAGVAGGATSLEQTHRGYAKLEVLACGGELKNSICLTRGEDAFVSQYLGDLENLETFRFFEHTINKMKRILKVDPKIIAYDLHPDYLSTKYAKEADGFDLRLPVQHHHAHIASCMAENGLVEKVIGIAWDGTGYGEDGCIWGGEFLVADFISFERKAFFSYLPLPGGQMAIREPYRMALSYLYQAFGEGLEDLDLPFLHRIGWEKQRAVIEIMQKGINSPLTSSAGRLFEALASLLGVRDKNSFEGQAAMELQYLASFAAKCSRRAKINPYPYSIIEGEAVGQMRIEVAPMIEQIVHELIHHEGADQIAFRFHLTMAEIAVEICCRIRQESGLGRVALSGGVFQNRLLTSLLVKKLLAQGFDCYQHRKVPPNDGGICLGQAAVAKSKYHHYE